MLEFLAIAHYSDLPDIILIEIFCNGINQPLKSKLRREGPFSSLAHFMDYALLTVGSLFTVGFAEDERDTASATEMGDAPEVTHKMAVTTTHHHVSADRHESSQVTVDCYESSHVSADLPESRHVFADHPESRHVSVDHPESHHESRHVSADLPESLTSQRIFQSLFTSPLTIQSLVTSQLICQSLATSRLTFQNLFTLCLPPQSHVLLRLLYCNPQLSYQGKLSASIRGWHPVWRIHRWCQHALLVFPNQLTLTLLFLH